MKDRLRESVISAFSKLKNNDGYLFDCPIEDNFEYEPRKLHEVCINHRLAVYLEEMILPVLKENNKKYFIDIEFNRERINKKNLKIGDKEETVRPDIIIHNRKSGAEKANFLIVECKKRGADSTARAYDRTKILEFMENEKYKYSFGLQVIYNKDLIEGTLFYKRGGTIASEEIV